MTKEANLMCLLLWTTVAATTAAEGRIVRPANGPAVVDWNSESGHLRLRYHDTVILDATVRAADGEGQQVSGSMITLELTENRDEQDRVEQRLKLTLNQPQDGIALSLQGTITGSDEAFAAETAGEAQRRFPLVRNSVGPSRNLRNNAVYDRRWDWVLIGPADGTTRITPSTNRESEQPFVLQCAGRPIELVFRPRFYQKFHDMPYFEPWTYRVWKGSVTGYCTWWAYKYGFTQETVDEFVELFAEKHLPDFGYRYIQLDDTYQIGNGSCPQNWLTWNQKFPGGPQYTINKIRSIGMQPGIWVHRVHRPSDPHVADIGKAHPDWFVQKADGSLYVNGGFYLLDTTNSEAVDQMARMLFRGLKEQGWDYVKIDGAGDLLYNYMNKDCEHHFQKVSSTPDETYRVWDTVAREELGPQTYILTCWGVFPAKRSISLVDGARLSDDGFQPRTLADFNYLEGVVWRGDPDHCDILGTWLMDQDAMMSVFGCDEPVPMRTIVRPATCTMAGGVLMLSDKAEVYRDDQNIEGMKRCAPVLFTVPGQLYSCGRNTMEWWLQEIDRPFDHWTVLARFQWGKKREEEGGFDLQGLPQQEVSFADLGLHDDREYLVFEFWTQKYLGKHHGSFLAPAMDENNGMQVFVIREAREHPWILSTTRHLSQGGVSLSNLKWDADSRTLSGKSAVIVGDPYVLTVHLPEGYRIESVRFGGEEVEIKHQEATATVQIVPSATATLPWQMTIRFAPPVDDAAFSTNGQTLAGENTEYLVDVHPLRQDGEMSIDCSPTGEPLDLGDIVYTKGIGVKGGSELTYDVSRREGRFEAWVGIDPNQSAERSGRFRVHADRELVFDSGVIHQAAKLESTQNPTRPVRVVVPLAGVDALRLTFLCEDNQDKAGLFGGWGEAKFVPTSAPEYEIGKYEGTTLAQTPPMGWNSWCRYCLQS